MQAKVDPNSRRFTVLRRDETKTVQPRAIPYHSPNEDTARLALIGLGLTALATLWLLVAFSAL
jgi:Uma2 family endonuclease